MADRSGRPSRRGGERSYDDQSRRDRLGRGGRDRGRDYRRGHDGEDDRDRDIGRDRNRDRERDRDRDHHRHRSRSRDRRDRRRSRSPIRDRGPDRRDERIRESRDDRGPRRRDEGRDGHRDRDDRVDREKERNRRRSVSPRRSASPPVRRDTAELDAKLPTRSKPATPTAPAGPVSFKVRAQDSREGSRGLEQQRRDGSQDSHDNLQHDTEDDPTRDRFTADPMEEDDDEDLVVEDDGLDAMQTMLGFGGFGTTKGQKVLGNNVGAVRKEKKTQYRQYMNRVGGFNRPLSPSR